MSLIYGMSLTAWVPFCELGFSVWRFGLDAWHNDIRGCAVCWQSFRPTREAQLYCSPRCRNLAKVRRHRSGYTVPPLPRYGRSGYRLSSLPLDGSQRFPPSFQSAWPHARSFTGRRLRTRILRGRLSQAAGMSRPKAEASYLGSRVEKFQKLMRADGAVAAKGRSHLAYGNIARGVRHGGV